MTDKQILDTAPEGATHVSDNGVYYFMDYPVAMNYWVRGQEWVESGGIHHLCRSLADIKEIEQLKGQLATAKADGIREFSRHLLHKAQEVPLGLENKSKGASVYNWLTTISRDARHYANQLNKEQGE